MDNILQALEYCETFVRDTWKRSIDTPSPVPGFPELKFDDINQRKKYSDSIVVGNALDVPDIGRFSRAVIATDPTAWDTEYGKPAWDMKPMLLGGPKTRLSAKGTKYNIIPFRHGVPSNNPDAHFKQMPKDIHEAARRLKKTEAVTVPLNLFDPAENYKKIVRYGDSINHKSHGVLLAKYPPQTKHFMDETHGTLKPASYTHKTSIYARLYKVSSFYNKVAQSQYMTFRTVSSVSPHYSWWHKARPAQPHIEMIKEYCRPKVEKRLLEAAKLDLVSVVDATVGVEIVREW